jgi:hypothetical protein
MDGREYLPDGRSRGFNENFNLAVKPGQGILSLEVPRHYDQAGSKAELIKTFS